MFASAWNFYLRLIFFFVCLFILFFVCWKSNQYFIEKTLQSQLPLGSLTEKPFIFFLKGSLGRCVWLKYRNDWPLAWAWEGECSPSSLGNEFQPIRSTERELVGYLILGHSCCSYQTYLALIFQTDVLHVCPPITTFPLQWQKGKTELQLFLFVNRNSVCSPTGSVLFGFSCVNKSVLACPGKENRICGWEVFCCHWALLLAGLNPSYILEFFSFTEFTEVICTKRLAYFKAFVRHWDYAVPSSINLPFQLCVTVEISV